jgi:hypothetical protein
MMPHNYRIHGLVQAMQWTGTPSGAETIRTWVFDSNGPSMRLDLDHGVPQLWIETNPEQLVPVGDYVVRYNMTEWSVLSHKAFDSLRPYRVHSSQMRQTA